MILKIYILIELYKLLHQNLTKKLKINIFLIIKYHNNYF